MIAFVISTISIVLVIIMAVMMITIVIIARNVPRAGSIEAERLTGRDVEVRNPHLDVLGGAQILPEMDMTLAAINERLASHINPRRAGGVFRGKNGERAGFDQRDRWTRMTVPTGVAARADYDLLHDRLLRVTSTDDLGAPAFDLELDVRRVHKTRPRNDYPADDARRWRRMSGIDERSRDECRHADACEHDRACRLSFSPATRHKAR